MRATTPPLPPSPSKSDEEYMGWNKTETTSHETVEVRHERFHRGKWTQRGDLFIRRLRSSREGDRSLNMEKQPALPLLRKQQRCFLLHLEPLLDPSRDLLGQGVATPPPTAPDALAPAAQPASLAATTLSRPWHLDLAVPDVLLPRAEPPVLLPPLASLDASSAPSRGPPAHSAVEASTV